MHCRFKQITGPDEFAFVDSICHTFLVENDTDVIEGPASKLNELQISIYQFQNEVLLLMGIGPDYERIDCIVRAIKKLAGWVDEVLIAALIGVDEVNSMRLAQKFSYQFT